MTKKDESLGSNLPANMDEETFLSAVRQSDKFEEERSGLNKRVGRFRKILKTMGVNLGDFDAIMRLRGLEKAEVTDHYRQQFKFARWLNLDLGSQGELFPKGEVKPDEDAAFKHGFEQGVIGKGKRQPPAEFNSDKNAQSWFRGWDSGQKKLGRDMFGKMDFAAIDDEEIESAGPSETEKAKAKEAKANPETKGSSVTSLDAERAKRDTSKPPGPPGEAKTDNVADVVKRAAAKGKPPAKATPKKPVGKKPVGKKPPAKPAQAARPPKVQAGRLDDDGEGETVS